MAFADFVNRMDDSEEKFTAEEIRDAGEKVIEKMHEENHDAREYMRAAIQVMITELQESDSL